MGRCQVSWFSRKKLPEFEIVTNDVPMSTVYRWYLYDTSLTDDINDIAEVIGLSRVSDEGEDKEMEDSERRMAAATPLFPFLESMAELSARVMSAIHITEMAEDDPELDEEDDEVIATIAAMHNVYKAVALSTLVGTISGALELGIIETNTISSDTYVPEGDDENE